MDDRPDMRIRAGAVESARRVAPWRPDIAWWAVGIEGVAALLLGLLLLFNQGAGEAVVAVLGITIIVTATGWAWSAMRSDLPQLVLGWRGLRAGAGIIVGVIVVLDFLIDFLPAPASLVVLAVGLMVVGAFGVAEWSVGRKAMGWRWPSLVGSAVAAGMGLIVLASRLQAAPLFLQVLAITAVVGGILLLVRAGLLWREEQALRDAPASSGGASSASTPIPQASAGTAVPTVTVRSAGSSKGGDPGTPNPPPAT